MKKLLAALLALAALTAVGRASADPLRYGVADDWPKFHACGDIWWQSAKDIGYQDLRMTVQWDETTPTVIPYQANLQSAIDCALLNNIRPILAVYPLHPGAIGSDAGRQSAFATFAGLVAQAFPHVNDIIVGNEPNVNRFWQPQYVNGQDAAGRDYEHTLYASYLAVKRVRPDISVWGPAISSRGNDDPNAVSNPSHSPVAFIMDMAQAYYAQIRADGSGHALFDEFDMHPYPSIQDTAPFSKPFQWPQAGAANLDRIKQVLYDAFYGTAQKVPAEQPGGKIAQFAGAGLPINLDEAGEQTVVTGHDGAYTSPPENVTAISEAQQAANHVELAEIAACDPDVKSLLYFPLIDNTSISGGFQSGNLFADLAHKKSYDAVKAKIASAHGNCQGGVAGVPQGWVHATGVLGAQPLWGGPGTAAGTPPPNRPSSPTSVNTVVTASEDATYSATIVRTDETGRPNSTVVSAGPVTGLVKAYYSPVITFDHPALDDGYYAFKVTLGAVTSEVDKPVLGFIPPRTTTFLSPPFTVGTPHVTVIGGPLPVTTQGPIGSMFPLTAGHITISSSTSVNQLLLSLFQQLGAASQSGPVLLQMLTGADPRYSQSARPSKKKPAKKLPTVRFRMTKGERLEAPKLPKVPAGRYRLRLTFTGAGGAKATITTPSFTLDAKGKLSLGQAKPVKKPVKPKPKPKKKKKK